MKTVGLVFKKKSGRRNAEPDKEQQKDTTSKAPENNEPHEKED